MRTTLVERKILQFIEKCGGMDKLVAARNGFHNCPDEKRAELIRNIAETDAGARQLMAAALLGFSVAIAVGRSLEGHADPVKEDN